MALGLHFGLVRLYVLRGFADPILQTSDANDWPNQGEIDIIEGVNDQSPNYRCETDTEAVS